MKGAVRLFVVALLSLSSMAPARSDSALSGGEADPAAETDARTEIARRLLSLGSGFIGPIGGQSASSPAGDLHEAVKKGDLDLVREILAKTPQLLNAVDSDDRTPLLLAAFSKQDEVFRFLIDRGADIHRPDKEGVSPLLLACFMGQDGWAELLILKGAEIDSNANALGISPLQAAVRGGHSKCAEILLAKGARLDLRDTDGRTPLLLAAWYNRGELARLLLSKGAPPDERDNLGNTALHMAALNGNEEIAKMLVAAGARLDAVNSWNGTPASIAVREGQEGIVRILRAAGAKTGTLEPPAPRGEYLGQKKPGLKPERFAPGVVSTEKSELNSVFTPDGREFYFTIQTVRGPWKIMGTKLNDGVWTKPEVASFSGVHSDVDLFISPDGRRLFFCSNRPLDGQGKPRRDYDIWVVERAGEGWSEPVNLKAPVNSEGSEFYPSVTGDGTLYFQSARPDARGGRDIYRARIENGAYRKVENLGEPINSALMEGDGLISPDEEYLVFSVDRQDGFGQGDLYVSFHGQDGAWTEPRNLGNAVNTAAHENCPILSPDGKFLFYTSGGDIYWVSAKVIETLRREP